MRDWYLVMPLDPTPQNFLDWFQEMPDKVIEEMEADLLETPEAHFEVGVGFLGQSAQRAEDPVGGDEGAIQTDMLGPGRTGGVDGFGQARRCAARLREDHSTAARSTGNRAVYATAEATKPLGRELHS